MAPNCRNNPPSNHFACHVHTASFSKQWGNINTLTSFWVYSKTVKFLRTVSTLRPLKTSSLWEEKNQRSYFQGKDKQHQLWLHEDAAPFALSSAFRNFSGFILSPKRKIIIFKKKTDQTIRSLWGIFRGGNKLSIQHTNHYTLGGVIYLVFHSCWITWERWNQD